LKKVLAVDDSPVILSLIKDILSNYDYRIETANNGEEALQRYQHFKPDVVTLDLTMPGMDGYQILVRIRQIDRNAKIVMISASEHSSALKDCLEKGAVGFLSKPFKPKELVDAIEKASKNALNHDNNIFALFSLVADKISNIMAGMYPSSGTSASLEDVKVYRNSIKSVETRSNANYFKTNNDSIANLSPDRTSMSEDQVTFLTDIGGQNVGMVLSFIGKSDLELLFGQKGSGPDSNINRAIEFFNIANTKVMSEQADATHSNLRTLPTVYLGRPLDKDQFWRSPSKLWDQIAKAYFELIFEGQPIPIEIQLWYDGGRIFS